MFLDLKKSSHWLVVIILGIILIYTRFVNLSWGLPYPMHPDERNMAVAMLQFSCHKGWSLECLHPHFFAYGQLPLYLSYFFLQLWFFWQGVSDINLNYTQAVLSLRLISAISAIIVVIVMLKIFRILIFAVVSRHNQSVKPTYWFWFIAGLLFIFSPGLIQFAHFGTTESLLMLWYLLLIYFSLAFFTSKLTWERYLFLTGVTGGFALATKVSAASFFLVPLSIMLWRSIYVVEKRKLLQLFFSIFRFGGIAAVFFVIFSPYNIVALADFLGTLRYEADVATGKYLAFYTRQFVGTIPVIFQFWHIFPYALGWPITILFILGIVLLPFRREYNLLRIGFFGYFLPTAFLFTKWTRFMSPLFPLMLIFAVLFLFQLQACVANYMKILQRRKTRQLEKLAGYGLMAIFMIFAIIPGIAYLYVYNTEDTRFQASYWVYTSMPNDSLILSETANVVDVPISSPSHPNWLYQGKTYRYLSFNFYDLETDPRLPLELQQYWQSADYIFIPSRRIFMNHTCYRLKPISGQPLEQQAVSPAYWPDECERRGSKYTLLQTYYQRLFSRSSPFQLVAEFSSYPQINLFGRLSFVFPDEEAEESWTVFDHPVLRIYKRATF